MLSGLTMGSACRCVAVPALARALKGAEPLVKMHAAWALGRIGGSEAIAALRDAVSVEGDAEVTEEIKAALSEIEQYVSN